jgi:hypothetical protein
MGCDEDVEDDEAEEIYDPEENDEIDIPIEYRVFVCLGTSKENNNLTSWVMVFNKSLTSVTMWDPYKTYKRVLPGRVHLD